jgi:hypothetical protein
LLTRPLLNHIRGGVAGPLAALAMASGQAASLLDLISGAPSLVSAQAGHKVIYYLVLGESSVIPRDIIEGSLYIDDPDLLVLFIQTLSRQIVSNLEIVSKGCSLGNYAISFSLMIVFNAVI